MALSRAFAFVSALLACTLVITQASSADNCVQYQSQLSDGSVGFCAGVVDTFYLPAGMTQEQLEVASRSVLTQDSNTTEKLLGLLPQKCTAALKALVCAAVFPQCNFLDPYFLEDAFSSEPGRNPIGQSWTVAATAASMTVEDHCIANGLQWRPELGSCAKAIPRLPCKTQCDDITSIDKTVTLGQFDAKCPLISGTNLFFDLLGSQVLTSQDPVIQARAVSILTPDSCVPVSGPDLLAKQATCRLNRYTANLLSLFEFAPSCIGTQSINGTEVLSFPSTYTFETDSDTTFFFNVVNDKVTDQGGTDCGPSGTFVACSSILSSITCAPEVPLDPETMQESFWFDDDPDDICADVTRDSVNQDATVNALLAGKRVSEGPQFLTANQATCVSEQSVLMEGAYFVPTYPGQPLLPGRSINATGTEDPESCHDDSLPHFVDQPNELTHPLCSITSITGTTVASNAKDCVNLKLQAAVFPPWVDVRCQVALKELACSQGKMKLEYKSLCMIPDSDGGCESDLSTAAANDRIAFNYLLPRFPSQQVCLKYREECADFIETQKATVPELDISCDAQLDSRCDDTWESQIWPCTSSFNGLPQYPTATQELLPLDSSTTLGDFFTNYITNTGITSLASAFSTTVVEPTISEALFTGAALQTNLTCLCPAPLVAPDDPNAPTVAEGICCAIRCEGTMSSDEEIQSYDNIVTIVNVLGVLSGLFMVLTWGLFKSKEKQKITFWLSVTALNVNFSLLLGAISSGGSPSKNWCKDNSQGQEQSDGLSMCVYQGIWLVFFGLSLCCWWFCSCFDLYTKLVRGKRKIEHYIRYYHFFSWGVPSVSTISLLAAGKFGFLSPRVWCFLGDDSYVAEWLGFYAIVAILWISGTICMFGVIVTLVRQIAKVEGESSSPQKMIKYMALYRTPLLFVGSFSVVWAIFVSFRIITLVGEEGYIESAQSWIFCLLGNAQAGVLNPAINGSANTDGLIGEPADPNNPGCGLVQPNRISAFLLGLSIFTLSAASFIIFLVFGVHRENFRLWAKALGCGKKPRKRALETSMVGTQTQRAYDEGFSDPNMGRGPPSRMDGLYRAKDYAKSKCARCLDVIGIKIDDPRAGSGQVKFDRNYSGHPRLHRAPSPASDNYLDLSYAEWEAQFMVDPLWGIR